MGYVHRQLDLPIASTAPLGKITDAFSAAMRRFAVDQGVPWVDFVKGQRKDDIMHEYLVGFEAAGRTEGVLFVGRAQEKTALFRTEKRRDAEGKAYPWIVKTTGFVNHFYLYAVDADFGPFFLKFCSLTTNNGARIAGPRFADTRAQALLCALLAFRLLPDGFTNRDLRGLVGQLLGKAFSAESGNYDLRRLRAHGLITRQPHSHRYRVTDTGLHHALLLTRAHDRLLRTGMSQLAAPKPGPLQTASRTYQKAIELAEESGLAA